MNLNHTQIEKVLKLLLVENPAPVIKQGTKWYRTPAPFKMDHERISFLTEQRVEEWQEIQDYLHHDQCLMNFLRDSLDDPATTPCGKCANCFPESALPVEIDPKIAVEAAKLLRQSEMPLKLKVQVANDAFPQYGFRGNLFHELRGEEGRILSRWGDSGWLSRTERFRLWESE